jgi:hypothetical protein
MRKSTLQRMLQLADIKPVIKEGRMNLSNFELIKESVDGNTYAIVRENTKYYIKSSYTKENLKESDFDYLGGLPNKHKKSFNSFEEATRNLNLMFEEINNHYDGVGNVNLLESDFITEKKYVLKLNKPKAKAKPEEPTADFDFGGGSDDTEETGEEDFDFGGGDDDTEEKGGDEFDFGGGSDDTEEKGGDSKEGQDEFDFGGGDDDPEEGDTESFDFGDDSEEGDQDLEFEDSDDEIKDIQSTTGKLGQQLRDVEDLSSDMQKWVAKSVLSALNLDNMDTEDKKDIIRTVKQKTKEENPEEETGEGDFDFGGEDDTEEESYMSYMEDDDKYLLTKSDLEKKRSYMSYMEFPEPCSHCGGLGHDEFTGEECEWCAGNYEDVSKDSNLMAQTDIDSALSYVSYMKDDKFSEKELNDWLSDMEMSGFGSNNHGTEYDSFMGDVHMYTEEDEETDRGGEPDLSKGEKILLDDLEDESLYGLNPNTTNRYSREPDYIAKKQAIKDMVPHFNKNTGPGYEEKPSENWRKYTIPFNTNAGYSEYDEFMSDITDKFETYEQELAYEDLVQLSSEYGYTVSLCHADKTEDPEESTIYFDIKDGSKKIMKARVNSIGDIELGSMKGKHFIGEPVDSLSDYDETFQEKGIDMGPQREKSPEKPGRETETKPGREKKRETDRPSRRPFNPPPHITPGEEPGPKAGQRRQDGTYDPTMAPAPAREPSEKPGRETETKPGREKKRETDRPSRRPFNPPPHITPGEEPGPKARTRRGNMGGDDVTFS